MFLLSTRAQRWHSNAGGGGERVLWTAIALMQRTEPDVISVVYSGDTDATKEQIIAKVKVRVNSRHSLLLLTLMPGSVRHHASARHPAFRLPRIKVARGGPCVATVHPPWAEPRFHVPCVGGYVEVCPRPLHR
jgi:hypothetical protein